MRKIRMQISVLVLCSSVMYASAQPVFPVYLKGVDKDSSVIVALAGIRTQFESASSARQYIDRLPNLLYSKGFITASVDSLKFDSLYAKLVLYIGNRYKWANLDVKAIDDPVLDAVGWREKAFTGKPIDFNQVQVWQDRILNHMENSGHPFAKLWMDSLSINRETNTEKDTVEIVYAQLKLTKGPLYKIDSIRIYGNTKISNNYLQRYLGIENGSLYNKEKLTAINRKIRELTYIEEEKPFDINFLGTGSVVNLYLKPKRSSQVNAIIGFLPNNDQLASKKMLIVGEANLLLRNAFGSAETIGLNFQALQVESQRLNVIFQYPYFFRTPLGLDFYFDFLRKDSSFVNLNWQLGAQYNLNTNEGGKIFIQRALTIVNQGAINSPLIIQTRRLPDVADVRSFNVGLDYTYNRTDYRLNPRKGLAVNIITSIGTKKIQKNNEILSLKDPADPGFDFDKLYDTVLLKTYQFRIKGIAEKYFPVGDRSTVKTALNGGFFQSRNIFRNELFQLGGFKLLRGFDEESQYLSAYTIGTVEYRYLVGQNSFFYMLADGGWGQDNRQQQKINYSYFGTGLGLAFETKAGIFNIAWAVGKRNDTEFNLRQSKIHFGFVNYF